MKRSLLLLTALLLVPLTSLFAAEKKPNVLLIADDLRPEPGCYGARHIQ